MPYQRIEITEEQIAAQREIALRLRAHFAASGKTPLALVDTYGCQQNESDSERIRGALAEMGFSFTDDEFAADVVVVNSCAVRGHASSGSSATSASSRTQKGEPGADRLRLRLHGDCPTWRRC
jgi:tRNA-2-methylthio-N6-dimethylallyladenosine synthase